MKNWGAFRPLCLGGACASLLSAGCVCVEVSDGNRMKIDELKQEGVTWHGEMEKESFQPVVKMAPAVCWSFLPGAGQHFVAHKMLHAGFYDGEFSGCRLRLQAKGTLMLAVSWIPFVYPFTLTMGMIGTVTDVNRVNNLALLESRRSPVVQESREQISGAKPKRAKKKGLPSVRADQQMAVPTTLTPDQRRALDELDSLHTAGLCTDDEYVRRRRMILTTK